MNLASTLKLILIASILRAVKSSFVEPIELSNIEESFVRGKIEYLMINLRVKWREAEIICAASCNSSLAVIESNATAMFLADALSETNLEMEGLWVGAKKISKPGDKPKVFQWLGSELTLDSTHQYFIKRGLETLNTTGLRNCLGFARQYHEIPHYIDLDCELSRPFICQKPYERSINGTPTTPDWIRTGDFEYRIFYDQKTWKQSVRECRFKHKAHLASFINMHEIITVGRFLLIGRPSLENAWIGVWFIHDNWLMLYDKFHLPEESNSEGFPPWRKNHTIKHSGCLLLDRHLAEYPVFIEAWCERRRSYICARKVTDNTKPEIIIMNNTGYLIYFNKKPWNEAQDECRKEQAWLVTLHEWSMPDIAYIMGENRTQLDHVWVGGHLYNNSFYWVKENQIIPRSNTDLDKFPPWYDNSIDENYACLNLDRENHNKLILYGEMCNEPQQFICVLENLPKQQESRKNQRKRAFNIDVTPLNNNYYKPIANSQRVSINL